MIKVINIICYIVVNKCGSVVYICDKCGLNARKQQKQKKKKYIAQLCRQHRPMLWA
jgi:hypothetical protein